MKNVKIEELVKNHSRTKDGIHLGSEDMVISILQKNIVEVRLTCGKGSLKTSLSPKALGVDISKKKDDTKEFFNDFVADGAIWHFPKPLRKRINNIPVSFRRELERNAIAVGINGYYVNKEKYPKLKENFQKKKEQFFAERDYILKNWDELYNDFKERCEKALEDLGATDKETILKTLLVKFPRPEEIKRNFYMDLIVQPYPTLSDMKGIFSEELFNDTRNGFKENAVGTFYQMIGTVLRRLFERISSVQRALRENGEIPSRTKGGIGSTLKSVENDNFILRNDRITLMCKAMRKSLFNGLSLMSAEPKQITNTEMDEVCEYLLANIYGYSQYLGIKDKIDISVAGYTESELEEIYKYSPKIETLTL